ncbi:Calcyphosin-2, partial [Cuculus canorus]
MDFEVKGVAASPQRQTQLSLKGEKHQGWRPDTRASRGPRPPEVPSLDLGRLEDSDGEDGDSYIPYTESHPYTCHLDRRTSLQTPYAQHHQAQEVSLSLQISLKYSTIVYGLKMYMWFNFCMTGTSFSERQFLICSHSIDILNVSNGTQLEDGHDDDLAAFDEKALLQRCYTSEPYNMRHNIRKEADDVAAERKKQAVVEQVMLDHLSRAVISDPEQSTHVDVYKGAHGLLGLGTAPVRFRKRTLHETQVRTKSGLTETMLSNKLCFASRIISRNGHDACRELIGIFFACDKSLTVYEFRQFGKNRTNALPFIQKGVYQHQRGKKKGKAYDLSDFYVVSILLNVNQFPVLNSVILHVISPINMIFYYYRASSMELKQECSKQAIDDNEAFKKIQGILREALRKRGVRLIIGLGKYFRQVDKNRNGSLSQTDFKEALKVFRLEIPERDFETLWLTLDDSKNDKVDYGEFTRAIFGEMNECRKAFVRKAYMKLDFNKNGSIPVVDIRKTYCAKKHPLVLAG